MICILSKVEELAYEFFNTFKKTFGIILNILFRLLNSFIYFIFFHDRGVEVVEIHNNIKILILTR